MQFTRDISELSRVNQAEMIRMLRAHLHTDDLNILMDRLQDWYLAILQYHSLEKYDPKKDASFETYLFNVACWGSKNRKKQKRDTVPIEDDVIDTQGQAEDSLNRRISEYRTYLTKNGGDNLSYLLEVLDRRIKGDICPDNRGDSLYRRHLRDFLGLKY